MHYRRSIVALALLTAACGASQAAAPDDAPPSTPIPTIGGVGALPDTIARESEPPVIIRPPVNEDGTAAELVGQQIAGNRIIMLGDSIMAATDRRFGGEMCTALVPLGWAVEIDAEPGRFVEFGNKVLDRRLDDELGWDAAVVFLGSNYRGDQAAYEAELLEIIGRLAPRPTMLFSVTEYRPSWAEVNQVVERIAAEFDNVVLLDWRTVAEAPGVLSSDGLHPTAAGELVLVDLTAAQVGRAPFGEGECLRSQFTDSSAISVSPDSGGSTGASSGSTSGGVSSGGGSSGGGSTTAPPTTSPPPPTDPPPTDPPPTDPPPTGPPPTSPPPTSPPTTDPPPPPPTTTTSP